jgi:hypothetical protein
LPLTPKHHLEREVDCKHFDVLFDPEEPRRFVLYEIYEDQVAFDGHLASSHYQRFADAIEGEMEQRSISRLAFSSAIATSEDDFTWPRNRSARRTNTPTSAEWDVT